MSEDLTPMQKLAAIAASVSARVAEQKSATAGIERAKALLKKAKTIDDLHEARGELAEANDAAKRIAEALVWKADAYVYRVRQWSCICSQDECQEEPAGLFVRYTHLQIPSALKLVALKSLDECTMNIPKLISTIVETVEFCPYCIQDAEFTLEGKKPEPASDEETDPETDPDLEEEEA